MTYYVYLLASQRNGTIYTGMTLDLPKRIADHKAKVTDGFTKKYDVKLLVYYESFNELNEARYRERRLKRWNRNWKIDLIEKNNPQWRDLYEEICA